MTALRLMLLLILTGLPFTAFASTCTALAIRIHNDINQHPDDLAKQAFPWKNLAWLETQLDNSSVAHMTDKDTFLYQWNCTADASVFIAATLDSDGHLQGINGKYDEGANGVGSFSACINNCGASTMPVYPVRKPVIPAAKTVAVAKPKPAVASKPQIAVAAKPKPELSCDDMVKRIHELAKQASISNPPHYPWDNPDWLTHHYGNAKVVHTTKGIRYEWHCQGNHNTIAQTPIPDHPELPPVVFSFYCDAKTCYTSYLINKGGNKAGVVMQAPK